jgi:hypothetical protein
MQTTRKIMCGLILAIFLSSCLLTVKALNADEWSSNIAWSDSTYYQGDNGNAVVTFKSDCPDQLKITYVGLHFDWMNTNEYYRIDLSSNPVYLASGERNTFSTISFNVPSGVSVGSHRVTLLIEGQQDGLWWYDISVTGSEYISIHDAYEKVYNQLFYQVQDKLSSAQNSNFQSPDAQSLLQQANTEFNLATSLSQQGAWQDAVSHLNAASGYIDQAKAKEQTYNPITMGAVNGIPWVLIVVIVLILVVIVAVVAISLTRKRKQTFASNIPPPP